MTTEEKINLLSEYDDIAILSEEHFLILQKFSFDEDSTVRSLVASLLVDFVNEAAKNILIRLAQDDEVLVRTEAYDSLAVFPFNDVEIFLSSVMQTESDNLARSYAILSWADVTVALSRVSSELILDIEDKRALEKSTDCSLSYCYVLYIFGNKEILEELLSYLKNSDYQIRCATIALLDEIIDERNAKRIKDSLAILLITEDTVAVKTRIKRFLEEN